MLKAGGNRSGFVRDRHGSPVGQTTASIEQLIESGTCLHSPTCGVAATAFRAHHAATLRIATAHYRFIRSARCTDFYLVVDIGAMRIISPQPLGGNAGFGLLVTAPRFYHASIKVVGDDRPSS
jgi:hypothetical protein